MKTIIAGSRSLGTRQVEAALSKYPLLITELVCGCAVGVDQAAYREMRAPSVHIPVRFFPAYNHQYTWAFFAKRGNEVIDYPVGGYESNTELLRWPRRGAINMSGYARNKRMADYAEALLAVYDGESRGTYHMIKEAENRGLIVTVHTFILPTYKPPTPQKKGVHKKRIGWL